MDVLVLRSLFSNKLEYLEVMDELSQSESNIEKAQKVVANLASHTSTSMINSIYDVKSQQRKDDKIKSVGFGVC